jgi:hypothetical protein
MDRRRTLPVMLALLLAFSGLLLTHSPVFGDNLSLEETYAPWLERIRTARADLDKLKAQREKAQTEYLDIVTQLRMRGNPIDPEKEAQAAAAIKEIEQRIRDREYEINTTIPDEARQAGVPSNILSQ